MDEIVDIIKTRVVKDGDAIMFDIDDTLIDNSTHEIIPHIKELLDLGIKLNYKIVIITARPGDKKSQEFTETELELHDIKYHFLGYCSPEDKSFVKQHLMKIQKWHFVLSVGDMPTDLTDSEMYIQVTS
tara:strand:- start:7721 stop:8107 length:387 start_codon:yes stop_codon:yes gene_type:complete